MFVRVDWWFVPLGGSCLFVPRVTWFGRVSGFVVPHRSFVCVGPIVFLGSSRALVVIVSWLFLCIGDSCYLVILFIGYYCLFVIRASWCFALIGPSCLLCFMFICPCSLVISF